MTFKLLDTMIPVSIILITEIEAKSMLYELAGYTAAHARKDEFIDADLTALAVALLRLDGETP